MFDLSLDCLVTEFGHVIGSNCSHSFELADFYSILIVIAVIDSVEGAVAILVAMVAVGVVLAAVVMCAGMTLTAES